MLQIEDSLDKFLKPHSKDTLARNLSTLSTTNSNSSLQLNTKVSHDSSSKSKKNVFFCEELNEFFPNDNPKTVRAKEKVIKSILKSLQQRKYTSEQRINRSKLKNLFEIETDDEDDGSEDEDDASSKLRANQRTIHLVEFADDDRDYEVKKKPLKLSVIAIEKVIPRQKGHHRQPNDALQELKDSLEAQASDSMKNGDNSNSVEESEKKIEKSLQSEKIPMAENSETFPTPSKTRTERPTPVKASVPTETFETKFLPKTLVSTQPRFQFSPARTFQPELNPKMPEVSKFEGSKELSPENSKLHSTETSIFKGMQLTRTEGDEEDHGVLERLRSRREKGGSNVLRNSSRLIIQNTYSNGSERQLELKKTESCSKLFSFR